MTTLQRLHGRIGSYTTKTDAAYEVLREAILAGVLAPGASIQAKNVADELDMSVIPVREALRRLEQDGLISIRPHVGATVRSLADEELKETMLIRGELEALAARLAAETIDDDTLAKLDQLVERMDECVQTGDAKRYGRLNREFHLTLYARSRYQRLFRLIESLWDQIPRARTVFALVPGYMKVSQHGHHQLMDALRRRDGTAAEKVIRDQKIGVLDVMLHVEDEKSAPRAARARAPKGRVERAAEEDERNG